MAIYDTHEDHGMRLEDSEGATRARQQTEARDPNIDLGYTGPVLATMAIFVMAVVVYYHLLT
jgi:hypothetical protein